MTNPTPSVRLAFRVEEDFWVAYCAHINTMVGSLELGRIQMRMVLDARRKELFMALMKEGFEAFLKDLFGSQVSNWEVSLAPEHEKGSRA